MRETILAFLFLFCLKNYSQAPLEERRLLKTAKVFEIVINYTSTTKNAVPGRSHVFVDTSGMETSRINIDGSDSRDTSLLIYKFNKAGWLIYQKTTSNYAYSKEVIFMDSNLYRENVTYHDFSKSYIKRFEVKKGRETLYINDTIESIHYFTGTEYRKKACKIVYYGYNGEKTRILKDRHYYNKAGQQYKTTARVKSKQFGRSGKTRRHKTNTYYFYNEDGLLKQVKIYHLSDNSVSTTDYIYLKGD